MFLFSQVEALYNCWLHSVDYEYASVFDFLHMLKGDNWPSSSFEQSFHIGFLSDTITN